MNLSKGAIVKIALVAMVVLGLGVYWVERLTRGPSTKAEVCASYDDLGQKTLHANGLFDNAIFNQAKDLADVAKRYDGQPSLAEDAKALERIGDSTTTNGLQLASATRHIANLCGHALLR